MGVVSIGVALAGALLLLVGGIEKLRDPSGTLAALGALRLPRNPTAGRLLGGVELAVGSSAVVWFGRPSLAAVGALYLGLAAAASRLRRSPDVGCGCIGTSDAPAGAVHVVLNAAFAVAALLCVVDPTVSKSALGGEGIWRAVLLIALAALIARLAHLIISELPRAWSAMNEGQNA